ncbi:MAG: hypothetical protein K1X55_10395 [Chitinophagales bacterium]|nr:hypothetical protein [Chitinophagales bacterium]
MGQKSVIIFKKDAGTIPATMMVEQVRTNLSREIKEKNIQFNFSTQRAS